MIKREELTNPASCMSKARDDEMTFVLLGRDAAAPVAIRAWVAERLRLGKNLPTDGQILEAERCAERMEAERVVRVISGLCCGASVVVHFVNTSGNLDCRFAEDFGPYKKGEIVVLSPSNVEEPANGR